MKREKAEPEGRKTRRQPKELEDLEQQKPHLNGGKKIEGSLVDHTFEVLDKLTRRLVDNGAKQIDQDCISDVKQVFKAVECRMGLQEMHSLEYSNRLSYIKSLIETKNLKTKNCELVKQLVEEQLARVQQLYLSYLLNFNYLQALKAKYDPSLEE